MYVHEDIESNNLITPAHFINVLLTTGTPTLIEDKGYGINRHSTAKILLEIWKKGQNHLNSAWKMWRDEYLLSLRERYQMFLKSSRIKSNVFQRKNQIVHIKDKMPRGSWRIARVVEPIIGRDGQIRSAKLILPSGITLTRPLNLLYPLETSIPNDDEKKDEEDKVEDMNRNDVKDEEGVNDEKDISKATRFQGTTIDNGEKDEIVSTRNLKTDRLKRKAGMKALTRLLRNKYE